MPAQVTEPSKLALLGRPILSTILAHPLPSDMRSPAREGCHARLICEEGICSPVVAIVISPFWILAQASQPAMPHMLPSTAPARFSNRNLAFASMSDPNYSAAEHQPTIQ